LQGCYSSNEVSGGENVGGIVGYGRTGIISNCFSTGTITGTSEVGGIAGLANLARISNSYSTSLVSGVAKVSGIAGLNEEGTISKCRMTGTVSGTGGNIGGIAGLNEGGTIRNCRMTGTVSGASKVGGIAGSNDKRVICCYAASPIDGHVFSSGGVVGQDATNYGLYVERSYWDVNVCGVTRSSGGTGLTTKQMKQKASFEGWDFVGESANGTSDIWRLCEDGTGYPRLSWEFTPADFDCPDGVFFDKLTGLRPGLLQ